MKYHPAEASRQRYSWDFWYYFDQSAKLFHILYLNADRALVKSGKHHSDARVGYAITPDFEEIEWVDDDVFLADSEGWDNTSIWSGDLVKVSGGYAFFYTSRDGRLGDGMTQNIGLALSKDLRSWERAPGVRIEPDARWYATETIRDDASIHAWRDPFLFKLNGRTMMLVSAKSAVQPLGRNGCVGLLRSVEGSLRVWEAMPPLFDPGWYSEVEVPQLLRSRSGGYTLVYSSQSRGDSAPGTEGKGGLQAVPVEIGETGWSARTELYAPKVILGESSGLYACRVIPELGGEIVGFDMAAGGLKRSGVSEALAGVDRDFSAIVA